MSPTTYFLGYCYLLLGWWFCLFFLLFSSFDFLLRPCESKLFISAKFFSLFLLPLTVNSTLCARKSSLNLAFTTFSISSSCVFFFSSAYTRHSLSFLHSKNSLTSFLSCSIDLFAVDVASRSSRNFSTANEVDTFLLVQHQSQSVLLTQAS